MAQVFEHDLANGMVGVKSFYAYRRTLDYDDVPRATANRIFELMKARGAKSVSAEQAKAFQDYMFFQILRLCEEHKQTIQLHTGYQSGNGNFLANANPLGLTKAFFRFPTVKFCLLHSSYPFAGELAALAKAFPNVYIDMAWAPMISPAFSEQALENFLGAVPNNKIMVFGGDNQIPEGTYGASVLAREVVARVLIDRVRVGELTEEEARALAVKLLRSNAVDAYRLREQGYRDPVIAAGPDSEATEAMRTHEGVISHWRVLGSFPVAASHAEAVLADVGKGDFMRRYPSEHGTISWTDARPNGAGTLLLGDSLDTQSAGVSYALAELYAKTPGRVTLLFGANTATEIFLNGRSVRAIPTGFFSDELTEIPLDLRQGENRLLVKIIAARGHGLTMRYWDLQIQGQVIAPDGLLVR